MYHRVINPEEIPYPIQPGMFVRPETFRMHCDYLASHCNVVTLNELVSLIKSKAKIPPKTVAITFDDGWADNYQFALPILKDHKLPATVFLATGFIDTEKAFWTDELALRVTALKEYSPERESISDFVKLILDLLHNNSIVTACDKSVELLKALPPKSRDSVLAELAALTDRTKPPRSFLSWKEVTEMAENDITFGSHTHNHQYLTELSVDEIKNELTQSLNALKSHLGEKSSRVFCYPGGYNNSVTDRVLLELGIETALTVTGVVEVSESLLKVGRQGVHQDIAKSISLFMLRVFRN